MALFDNLNSRMRKRLEDTLNYPVLHVSDDYSSDQDFFKTFRENLVLARNNMDKRLGYVLSAIDVTATQLGLDDDDLSEKENNTHRRMFLPMTPQQTDIVISMQMSVNLEAFFLMFSDFLTRDILHRPDPNAVINVIEPSPAGDITDIFVVPLVRLPLDPNLIRDAKRLTNEGYGDSIATKARVQKSISRLHDQLNTEVEPVSKVIREEVISDGSADTPKPKDNPYSASALHEMYDNIGDDHVSDEAVDFIFAMMEKMTESQKDKVSAALSRNWSATMGPRVGSLLLSTNSLAEDIPVSSKNYMDRIDEIFGDTLSTEAKTHMVVQFHSALVQKIV